MTSLLDGMTVSCNVLDYCIDRMLSMIVLYILIFSICVDLLLIN